MELNTKIKIFVFLICITLSTPSHAFWWMVYHKPAFQGKVIDAETKKPIEGAVVVAVYKKYPIISGPGGGSESIMDIKEILTDAKGEFYFPSYTTVIQPFSIEGSADFIIFKPGYGSFPDGRIYPPMRLSLPALEDFFSGKVGTEGEVAWDFEKERVTFGIVELPKLKTREERINSLPSIAGLPSRKMQNLIRLFNEEAVSLGLKPISLP